MKTQAISTSRETLSVPKASSHTLPKLRPSLESFAPLFGRSTNRESLERYGTGVLTDMPRKNCDTIAAAVAEPSTERLQHLLTDAAWQPQALDQHRLTAQVAQSPPQGICVVDDTGLPKHGRGSVGVARQYSGTLGNVANCQIVVHTHYVADTPTSSAPGHWPVTASFLARQRWLPASTAGFPPSGSSRRSRRSIARYSHGSSKMSCCGAWRRTRLLISAPGGT